MTHSPSAKTPELETMPVLGVVILAEKLQEEGTMTKAVGYYVRYPLGDDYLPIALNIFADELFTQRNRQKTHEKNAGNK